MKGSVIIKKEQEPNGVMYYMTGKRDALTNWDMNGNYTEEAITIKENVHNRFTKLMDAIAYAKESRNTHIWLSKEEKNMKLEKVKEFLFALFITLGLPYMLLVLAYVLG